MLTPFEVTVLFFIQAEEKKKTAEPHSLVAYRLLNKLQWSTFIKLDQLNQKSDLFLLYF